MTIADVIYQSALWAPVDFKTVLHVKFPTSKSRQIGFTLLERANDQHSRGDQKTIKGPYLLNLKWQYFNRGFEWTSPNSQHLILQVNKCYANLSTSPQGRTNRTSYITRGPFATLPLQSESTNFVQKSWGTFTFNSTK